MLLRHTRISSLKQKTFNNIAFNAVTKVVSVVFQGVALIILTRTLLPSDYGIVGFAMIFVNFLSQFNDMGFSSAVVQRKDLDDRALYTGFTFRLGLAVFLYVVAVVGSGASGWFIENEAVANVIKVSALSFLIYSFSFVPTALLKRDLNYKKISYANMCYTMTNSVLAIILALAGFKYWSIVIANLCASLVMVVTLNLMRPKKIQILVDTSVARELFKFGGSVSLSGLIVFALFNTDNFIIGAVAGATMLGYYVVAFNWGSMICTALGTVVNSVLFPTFSRMQDAGRIKASYLKVLEYVTFAGVLVNVTLLLVSREFLIAVLGHGTEKWIPALKALWILCFYGIARFSLEPIGSVVMATGRVNLLLKANVIAAIIELSLLYPAVRLFGLEGVAVVVTVAYISQYLIFFPSLRRDIGLHYGEFFLALKPALLSALVVTGVVLVLQPYMPSDTMTSLVIKLSICTALYCLTYGIFSKWKLAREVRVLILNMRPNSS